MNYSLPRRQIGKRSAALDVWSNKMLGSNEKMCAFCSSDCHAYDAGASAGL
jgi:hypothetical protein